MHKMAALILAAGEGRRMGKPKAFLQIDGRYFVDLIYEKIQAAAIDDIYCVIRDDWDFSKFRSFKNIHWIVNENPAAGMISSVYYGMKQMSKTKDACLICPVDHPFVLQDTIKNLVAASHRHPEKIIKPACQEKVGHPIVLPKKMYPLILENKFTLPLRDLIGTSKMEMKIVAVADPNIHRNINTPQDLEGIG